MSTAVAALTYGAPAYVNQRMNSNVRPAGRHSPDQIAPRECVVTAATKRQYSTSLPSPYPMRARRSGERWVSILAARTLSNMMHTSP